MLLDALSKLKRQSILIAILLMCLGIVLLVCPEEYVSSLIMIAGYIMIIYSLEQTLEFLSRSNSLMNCITFVIAIFVGLVGLAVLVFHENILNVHSWIFGLVLILEGGHGIFYSYTFARRSGRSGWSILAILNTVLVVAGILLIVGEILFNHVDAFGNPVFLMKLIGCAVLFSALVSALKIVWISPAKNGGDTDEEEY